MSGSCTRKFNYFFLCFLLTAMSGNAPADDTEIYFSNLNSNAEARSNALFILDTSGSMSEELSGDAANRSRMEVMKEAMTEILSTAEDINVGLMRFTGSSGGAVLYPISYIDDPIGDSTVNLTISSGNNDAEENLSTSAVLLTGQTLDTSESFSGTITSSVQPNPSAIPSNTISNNDADEFGGVVNLFAPIIFDANTPGNDNTFEGLRFTGLSIPADAVFGVSTLRLVNSNGSTGGSSVIQGENVGSSSVFTATANDISSRARTTAGVTWSSPTSGLNTAATSPDIRTVLQEIVTDAGAVVNNLSLIIHNTTGANRSFYSTDTTADSTRYPRLNATYATTTPSFQNLIALRFENVPIPTGTTITNATLKLTSKANLSGPTTLAISAEVPDAVDGSSDAFTTANGNLSGRTKTASVDWVAPDMVQDTVYSSSDISSVIQSVVSNGNWCGGNTLTVFISQSSAAAFGRDFYSFNDQPADAPQLNIEYDPATATGCFEGTETAQVAASYDDAEEDSGDGGMSRTSSDLDIGNDIVGIRFQEIDIPADATILSAFITFTASSNKTAGNPTVRVYGELTSDADNFDDNDDDISNRDKTTAFVDWQTGDWSIESTYTTLDLKTIVEEIVDSSNGWASGNSMVFIIEDSNQTREAYSYNGSASKGPRIVIEYSTTGSSVVKTVRDVLIELVNELPTSGNTPIVEALYEATHYWRGENVVYGKSRAGSSTTRISHIDSYTGGTVFYPSGCSEDNLNDFDCSTQAITGSPVYISPFGSSLTCQSNYQILLTDGEANSADMESTIKSEYLGATATCATQLSDTTLSATARTISTSEKCAIELAEFMAENDQSDDVDNDQFVKTYTIGFDFTSDSSLVRSAVWLGDIASAGQGDFFNADDSETLISAFETFIGDVKNDPTSFVAPALATNSFNRLLSRDEAYFGLFTPTHNVRWDGNLKKYNICIDSDVDDDGTPECTLGEILDATGASAVGSDSKFNVDSQSIWSDTGVDGGTIDGRETTLGGVGGEMDDYTDRIIYTDTTSAGTAPAAGTELSEDGHMITSANWTIADLAPVRTLVCPTPSTTAGSQCESYMLWMLGSNAIEQEASDSGTNTRWTVQDVLHSSPQVITYGGADTDTPADGVIDTFYDKVVFGTNDGGLRMVNGSTGKEEWSFIPAELMNMQRTLITNPEDDHLYGMDATPTLRVYDDDFDGFIEPADGDFVHIYMAMRRGGTSIYALDLTDSVTSNSSQVVPKFLWRIEASDTGFERLSETWSAPRLATIKTGGNAIDDGGTNTEVLIFGGGYDPALEGGFGTTPTGGAANDGNAIYFVEPDTGTLIFSIGGPGSGSDIEVPNMLYSIPGEVSIADTDGDGDDDRLFFGDTGGQIWRVDLGNDIDTGGSPQGSTIVGRLASIAVAADTTQQRRFFETPSYVQVVDSEFSDAAGGEYDYILLGTGDRGHPLDETVADRFYAFRDLHITTMPDTDSDNLADSGYPDGPAVAGPILNSDMIDITNQVLDSSNASQKSSLGWYFDFDSSGTDGEKVLSSPRTIAGAVLFTTYEPSGGSVDPCTANVGGGSAYNIDILTTKAFLDWDGDGSVENFADRKLSLGGGIPSDVVPVFTKEGVVGIVGVEGGAAELGQLSDVPRVRTYWYEDVSTL